MVTTQHLRRAELSMYRDLPGRISQKTAVEGKGKAWESKLIFRDNSKH